MAITLSLSNVKLISLSCESLNAALPIQQNSSPLISTDSTLEFRNAQSKIIHTVLIVTPPALYEGIVMVFRFFVPQKAYGIILKICFGIVYSSEGAFWG